MSELLKKSAYIKGIDGLRALAVIAVMIFHLDPVFLPGGFSGVDVFFVISGYVVCSSLIKHSNERFDRFILGFYARRIIRIFPALIFCLIVAGIFTTLFVPKSWLSMTTSKTGLFAYFGLSNYALVWFNDGYFSPRVEFNSFTHTWSLAVEEQFYLFFPFLIYMWLKHKDKCKTLISLAIIPIVLLAFYSLYFSFVQTNENPQRAFYLLPSRFWELAVGALIYVSHYHGKLIIQSPLIQRLVLISGSSLVVLAFIISNKNVFPFPWALLSVVGTAFLIIGLVSNLETTTKAKQLFESKSLVEIGKRSYSLYLWHWPVYVLFRWTTGLESFVEMFAALLITIILACFSYNYVEKPIRNSVFVKTKSSFRVVFVGIIFIGISYFITKLIFDNQPKISLSVTADKQFWEPQEWIVNTDLKKEYSSKTTKLFILGDSHAGAYSPMLHKLSSELNIQVVNLSKAGCAVVNLISPMTNNDIACQDHIKKVIEQVSIEAQANDIVFLASLRAVRFGDQWSLFSDDSVSNKTKSSKATNMRELAFEEGVSIIQTLQSLNVKIIIDAPKPIFKSPVFRCADWFNKSNPICLAGHTMSKHNLLDHRKHTMESLQKLSIKFPKLIIWDPFPLLCVSEQCSSIDNKKPLFVDGDHLSTYGNKVLYPSFKTLIHTITN